MQKMSFIHEIRNNNRNIEQVKNTKKLLGKIYVHEK